MWAKRYEGERDAQVARILLGTSQLTIKVTAWDVSSTRRSLLPLWAKRLDVLVHTRGPEPLGGEEKKDPASAVLEELLPSAHPLSVVAIVDTSETQTKPSYRGADVAAQRLIIHASLVGKSTKSMEERCGDLLSILVARRLHVLQAQVVVTIPRFYRIGEATFYEVRCELRDDAAVGWTNPRRYREFEALYADLFRAQKSKTSPLPPVPPARRSVETVISKIGLFGLNESHLERRRKALDSWLRALVARPKADGDPALTTFLDPADHLKTLMLRRRTKDLHRLDAALDGDEQTDEQTAAKTDERQTDERQTDGRHPSKASSSSSQQQRRRSYVAVDDELYFRGPTGDGELSSNGVEDYFRSPPDCWGPTSHFDEEDDVFSAVTREDFLNGRDDRHDPDLNVMYGSTSPPPHEPPVAGD